MNVNIGKAVLYQLLGVKPNYKKLTIKTSLKNSPCKECPYMEAAIKLSDLSILKTRCHACSSCSLDLSSNQISDFFEQTYINETNIYGNKQKACRNSILLFMLLHAYSPSKSGFIYSADISTLAQQLNINPKTVKNCLHDLASKQYIEVFSCKHNQVSLILCDYKNYFLTADKGGRGYIKLTDEILTHLINIPNILSLRLLLRQLLNSDYETETEQSYNTLRLSLPKYCKRNVIQKKISSCPSSLFEVILTQQTVSFKLNEQYQTKRILKENIEENTRKFSSIIADLENIFFEKPTANKEKIMKQFTKDIKEPVLINVQSKEKLAADLATIASRYSFEIVVEAFSDIYRLRMCQNRELIQNIPACITSTIKSYGLDDGITKPMPEHNNTLAEAV